MNHLSDNFRGAFFMILCMSGFAINDALMKSLAGELGLFQAIFVRGCFATLMIGGLALKRGVLRNAWSHKSSVLGLRLIGEIGGTLCFLTALFHIPLANATAILQVIPLAVTLAAAVFMGEKVGWRRFGAIGIGFAGVMIIVRPGAAGFSVYSFFALAAVFFLVIRDLSTRRLAPGVPSLFVAFSTSVAITVVGGLVAPFQPWPPISGANLLVLCGAAVFLFIGYLFGVMAMRVGEIGFVSPFRYTILIWAILLGMVMFGNIPDAMTLLGSAIVVGMGIYTFFRERVLARRAILLTAR